MVLISSCRLWLVACCVCSLGEWGLGSEDLHTPAGMVALPAGVFLPFYSTEKPEPVAAFYLDQYAVTNQQFLEFVLAEPRWQRSRIPSLFTDANYLKNWKSDTDLGDLREQGPVVYVSWFAAQAYAEWKDKRLPTLAEWEYAATENMHAKTEEGEDINESILRWYSRPTEARLPPIGSGSVSKFGVHDLHGLVWEWIDDFNSNLVTGESRGDGGLERNLFCGSGSLGAANAKDYGGFMRYAMRSSLEAAYTTANLGFRCAKDIPVSLNVTPRKLP